jgi:hypothetical protein
LRPAVGARRAIVLHARALRRGAHLVNRVEQRIRAPHAEDRFILSGEGRVREVLGNGGRSDSDRSVAEALGRRTHRCLVGLADDREAIGHRESRAHQLAEIRRLGAYSLTVDRGEVSKRDDLACARSRRTHASPFNMMSIADGEELLGLSTGQDPVHGGPRRRCRAARVIRCSTGSGTRHTFGPPKGRQDKLQVVFDQPALGTS